MNPNDLMGQAMMGLNGGQPQAKAPFNFDTFMNNPMTMMALNMLANNQGSNKRAAFANAMGGGLKGYQAATLAALTKKKEEREQAEDDRKEREYQRMLAQQQALQKYAAEMQATGKQPSMYDLIRFGESPYNAAMVQNLAGSSAEKQKDRESRERVARMRAANSGDPTPKPKAPGIPAKNTQADLDRDAAYLEEAYGTKGEFTSPSTWWDDDFIDKPQVKERISDMASQLQRKQGLIPGAEPLSRHEALNMAYESIFAAENSAPPVAPQEEAPQLPPGAKKSKDGNIYTQDGDVFDGTTGDHLGRWK